MSEQTTTMSRLEQRYRLLLKVLPAAYRATWQEEMVTTFLASMHTDDAEQAEYLADYGRPSWSEVASVVALAVRLRIPGWRLRLGGAGAPPRNAVWGDAIRLVALIGLLSQSVSSLGMLRQLLWLTGQVPGLPSPPEAEYVLHSRWFPMAVVASFIWLPAYLALLFGHRRVSQFLAALALALTYLAQLLNEIQPVTTSLLVYAGFDTLLVLALAAFHRDAPPVRRRAWLLALAVGITLEVGLLLTVPGDPRIYPLLDWSAVTCLALVSAAAYQLARRRRAAPSWTLALALIAPAVLSLRVMTAIEYAWAAPVESRRILLILGIAESGVVLAAGIALAAAASQALRRLPAPT